jgi:hypothetical protein
MMDKAVEMYAEQKNEYTCKGSNTFKKENTNKHRIIVLGDSHKRGMASNLQHQLRHNCAGQGIVKPEAMLKKIVGMPTAETRNLTRHDVCVIWGGTHDVGKNEIQMGLSTLWEFINSHKHTNVIIVTTPHRHDLEANSCVNNEVKTFNRKMKKYVKVYGHVHIIDVETNRRMFTTHGLHLNNTGKEQITTKMVKVIKDISNGNQENILKLEWKKGGKKTGEGSIDDHPQTQE